MTLNCMYVSTTVGLWETGRAKRIVVRDGFKPSRSVVGAWEVMG